MLNNTLSIQACPAPDVKDRFEEIAQLRMRIFRDYPYLYDGTLEYEKGYLEHYFNCPKCVLVLVYDQNKVVGASTAIPLKYDLPETQQPFLENSFDIDRICYFGESVLLPEYRQQGIGRRFFQEREAHAKALGLAITTFCSVARGGNHPKKPPSYYSLEDFWSRLGYTKQPQLIAHFSWRELGEEAASLKPMHFWTKHL